MSSIGKEMFFRQYERILAEQEDEGRVDYDKAADQAVAAVRDQVADMADDARKRARESFYDAERDRLEEESRSDADPGL